MSNIRIPVYVLSGWQDGYKNPAVRILTALGERGVPVEGMIGPWGHKYPFDGFPGPRIEWLDYIVTHWWDRWLKGRTPEATTQRPQLMVGWANRAGQNGRRIIASAAVGSPKIGVGNNASSRSNSCCFPQGA